MRRVVLFAGSLAMLASCAQTSVLPQDQVLEKAVRAARDLQSVRFELHANMEGSTPLGEDADLSMVAQGWTQQERKQLQTSMALEGSAGGNPMHIEADIVLAGDNETYLNLNNLSSTDPQSPLRSPFFNLILNQWWRLPSDETQHVSGITPDPRLLELQMQAVRITEDHGIKSVNGKPSYHYDLAIDREKMLHFLEQVAQERKETFDASEWQKTFNEVELKGSAWIDAGTFQLNRLEWDADSKNAEKKWHLTFDVTFSDHNAAPVIVPPSGAKEMPSLPDLLPSSMTMPPGGEMPGGMPPEMQRQLLESLLNP
jgi:hypothetical protein